jgi:folylpolyglutamate synthase/dihydropteroate synthase
LTPGSASPVDGSLADWLAYVERLHPRTIELGLERVRSVAQRMALALDAVVITVAGTNGKGSTCAMLESILLARRLSGCPVHLAAPARLQRTRPYQSARPSPMRNS